MNNTPMPGLTKAELYKRIAEERNYQDYKWGEQNHSDEKWCTIILEEVGEAAQAINQGDGVKARAELIQTMAVIEACLTTRESDES